MSRLRSAVPAFLLFAAYPLDAQVTGAERASVDSVFADIAPTGPGCAVGIGRAGTLVHAAGYGLADIEHGLPITPQTPFYIASTSKQFAAFAIVLLARDGRLQLDDDIRRYLPELADFGATITVRHLLHHTSGLRDYFELLGGRGWAFDALLTEEEFLRLVARQRELNFPPGAQHLYSNTGYVLLSLIVNRVRGQSLRQFAEERIFQPLGMTRSVFRDDHRMLVPGRALAYEMIPGNALRLSVPNFDVVGDGGLYSTVQDLVRWGGNAHTPRAGDAADWRTLTTRGVLSNGDTIPYALGVRHDRHGNRPMIAHGGAFGGYRAEFLRFPGERLDVAVLCNFAGANPTRYAQRVADVFLPPAPSAPAVPAAPAAPAVPSSRVNGTVPAGTWMTRWTERWVRLVSDGDSLVASGPFARTRAVVTASGVEVPTQRMALVRSSAPGQWELALGGAGREPLERIDAPLPSQGTIAATMGDYVSPESDARLTLIIESGQLTLRRPGAPPTRLAPLGGNRWVAGPVVVTMLGSAPFDSLRVSTPRAARVRYVRARE